MQYILTLYNTLLHKTILIESNTCVLLSVCSIRLIVSLGVVTSSRMKCKTLSCVYNLREIEKSIMTWRSSSIQNLPFYVDFCLENRTMSYKLENWYHWYYVVWFFFVWANRKEFENEWLCLFFVKFRNTFCKKLSVTWSCIWEDSTFY